MKWQQASRRKNKMATSVGTIQLFHELKQKFPEVSDSMVNYCIQQFPNNKKRCMEHLEKESQRVLYGPGDREDENARKQLEQLELFGDDRNPRSRTGSTSSNASADFVMVPRPGPENHQGMVSSVSMPVLPHRDTQSPVSTRQFIPGPPHPPHLSGSRSQTQSPAPRTAQNNSPRTVQGQGHPQYSAGASVVDNRLGHSNSATQLYMPQLKYGPHTAPIVGDNFQPFPGGGQGMTPGAYVQPMQYPQQGWPPMYPGQMIQGQYPQYPSGQYLGAPVGMPEQYSPGTQQHSPYTSPRQQPAAPQGYPYTGAGSPYMQPLFVNTTNNNQSQNYQSNLYSNRPTSIPTNNCSSNASSAATTPSTPPHFYQNVNHQGTNSGASTPTQFNPSGTAPFPPFNQPIFGGSPEFKNPPYLTPGTGASPGLHMVSPAHSMTNLVQPQTPEEQKYIQALLMHQIARKERLQKDLDPQFKIYERLKKEVQDLQHQLENRKATARSRSASFPTSEDVAKLREQNRKIQLDVQVMTREIDLYQVPLGILDPSEQQNFYKNMGSTGQQGSVIQQPPEHRPLPPPPITTYNPHPPPLPPRHPPNHPPAVPPHHLSLPPHQSTLPPVLPPPDDGQEDEGEHWSCTACTFLNHPALNKCECCEMPRMNLG